MAITMKTLADACGVARSTVANILAGRGQYYAKATRERVQQAAKEMGYQPSQLPVFMKKGFMNTVGIMLPKLFDPYFGGLVNRMANVLAGEGLKAMVDINHLSREDIQTTYADFVSMRPRALILVCTSDPSSWRPADMQVMTEHTTFVTVNRGPWRDCPAVYHDRQVKASLAVEHLVALGHRRIGVLSGQADPDQPRMKMLRTALGQRDLPFDPNDFHYAPVPGPMEPVDLAGENLYALGKSMALTDDRPTSLICFTDIIASRFLAGFLGAGGRVPDDLSMICYNETWFAQCGTLPMTVVGVDLDDYARSVKQVIDDAGSARASGRGYAEHVVLQPELIVRASTGGVAVRS